MRQEDRAYRTGVEAWLLWSEQRAHALRFALSLIYEGVWSFPTVIILVTVGVCL